jgi:hypothetical protein
VENQKHSISFDLTLFTTNNHNNPSHSDLSPEASFIYTPFTRRFMYSNSLNSTHNVSDRRASWFPFPSLFCYASSFFVWLGSGWQGRCVVVWSSRCLLLRGGAICSAWMMDE